MKNPAMWPNSLCYFLRDCTMVACVIALVLVAPRLNAECRVTPVQDYWELEVLDVEPLYDRLGYAEVVWFHVDAPAAGRAGELESAGYVHALYDLPIEALADALADLEGQADFLPRLARAEVLCVGEVDGRYASLLQRLSFRLLFFRRDYEYVLHYMSESEVDRESRFRAWWELDRAVEGNVVGTDGSWILERVEVNGRELTYAGYAVRTVFERRAAGLATVLRRFGARDMKRVMDALAEEATARRAAAGT